MLVVAMLSPLFIIPLYAIPIVRDEFITSYAMGPRLILIPEDQLNTSELNTSELLRKKNI